jgi:hypothetical protein
MALSMMLRVNFQVTKDVRKAAGLGLDIAQRIVVWWSDTVRTTEPALDQPRLVLLRRCLRCR